MSPHFLFLMFNVLNPPHSTIGRRNKHRARERGVSMGVCACNACVLCVNVRVCVVREYVCVCVCVVSECVCVLCVNVCVGGKGVCVCWGGGRL